MKKLIILVIVLVALGWFLFKDSGPKVTVEEIGSSPGSGIVTTLSVSPERPTAGEPVVLTFSFTDLAGDPVVNFMTHHSRKVHTLILAENMSSIGHIHPDDFPELQSGLEAGQHKVQFTFPESGRYIVGVDTMNVDGAHAKQFAVNISGSPRMSRSIERDFGMEKCFKSFPEQAANDRYVDAVMVSEAEVECDNDSYKISLLIPNGILKAGEEAKMQFHIEKGGRPVEDLEPFLDQEIHFAIMPESAETVLHRHGVALIPEGFHVMPDGTLMKNGEMEMEESMEHMDNSLLKNAEESFLAQMQMEDDDSHDSMEIGGDSMEDNSDEGSSSHSHHDGTVPNSFGPDLVSESVIFPEAGIYRIFGQVKHNGNIIFMAFMVDVEEALNKDDAQSFELEIKERTLTPEIVTVDQGEGVLLNVSTDEAGEFHIAGYEIERNMDLEDNTEILFTAHQAGRYNLELHPDDPGGSEDDIVIGVLVVNPN